MIRSPACILARPDRFPCPAWANPPATPSITCSRDATMIQYRGIAMMTRSSLYNEISWDDAMIIFKLTHEVAPAPEFMIMYSDPTDPKIPPLASRLPANAQLVPYRPPAAPSQVKPQARPPGTGSRARRMQCEGIEGILPLHETPGRFFVSLCHIGSYIASGSRLQVKSLPDLPAFGFQPRAARQLPVPLLDERRIIRKRCVWQSVNLNREKPALPGPQDQGPWLDVSEPVRGKVVNRNDIYPDCLPGI